MTVPPALRSASPSSLRKQGSHRTRQRQGKGRAPARKIAPEDISGFRGGRVSKKRLEDGFGVFLSHGQRPGAALIATPSAKGRFFPAGKGANSGRSCIEHTVRSMLALQCRQTQNGFAAGGFIRTDLGDRSTPEHGLCGAPFPDAPPAQKRLAPHLPATGRCRRAGLYFCSTKSPPSTL